MNRRRPRPISRPIETAELTIERLGTDGAGLAHHDGRILAVPDALPGERVRVRIGAAVTLLERHGDSPDRVTPPCPHYGPCGGCSLQHLAAEPYAAFKRELVVGALARQGLEAPVRAALISPPASRRRAGLEARRLAGGTVLGFHGRASHHIVDLAVCPVLRPELVSLLPALRDLSGAVLKPGEAASIRLTLGASGIDVGLELPSEPALAALERLSGFARPPVARVWWRVAGSAPMLAAQPEPFRVRFGEVAVELPFGAFLQATEEGEAALTDAVREGVGRARRIADLFAGSGTFTMALAEGRVLHAVEGDAAAVAAIAAAGRRHQLTQVTTERRDLEARPLLPPELAAYDAVIFDPPRAGARAQAELLAQSRVPIVVGVSCNPATFARDAAILAQGGYRLDWVQPVDQFLWSGHVELVGRFSRRD
ncbi:MAG TPA: class I SAM-dependent RNA methyltransferase [Aliidongia sp.]|nr:class I SAM-dependent RNA methyltransferase [Aliidongia sp.]